MTCHGAVIASSDRWVAAIITTERLVVCCLLSCVQAHVRAMLIKRRTTQEGEVIPLYQYDLLLGEAAEVDDRLFMVWPIIVEHRINKDSPFWDLSAESLQQEVFELVVVLEGIVESTGMTTQARTSYLPNEILWGHRFERLVTYQRDTNQYMIDYSRFHSTVAIDMPPYSAKQLSEMTGGRRGSTSSSISSGSGDDDAEADMAAASVQSDPPASKPVRVGSVSGPSVNGRRRTIPSLTRSNGISSAALAAFDLQPDDEQSFQTMIDCNRVALTTNTDADNGTYGFF